MNSRAWALALALVAAGAMGSEADDDKKPAEPFYRKYLIPGNRLDDRILEQEKRIQASPDDASLRNDFGNLLAERRFFDQAAEQYEIAAKLDESNFIALYNLGLLREAEGKQSKAISAYQKSIGRKTGFPQSHFRLGRLYELKGRSADAVQEYSRAMLIDPSMRDPRRNPLAVDSELMYQASLLNYSRDMASASMAKESVYVEEHRFRRAPVDRPLTSEEAAGQDELEPVPGPRQIGTANAAGSAMEGGGQAPAPKRPAPAARVNPQDEAGRPPAGRPGPGPMAPRRTSQSGTPVTPGAAAPPPPPAVEMPAPEEPTESMPEPTPEAPMEEEPS